MEFFTTYIRLGSLDMRSRAIESFDWADLFGRAPKRGENRVLPGQPGRVVRPRVPDELRAALYVRVSGEWTTANIPVADANREATFYSHLATVQALADVTSPQLVRLVTPGGSFSSEAQVESMSSPRFLNPYTAEVTLDLTLPTGGLNVD